MKVYSNGDLVDKEKLGEIFEPGFLFGWGVFEPLRTYKGNIPFLAEHIERLNKSLELIGIERIELDWEKVIQNLLRENSLDDAYLRITVYKKRKGTGLLIYTDKFSYYTQEVYAKGFSAVVSPYVRSADNICSKLKSLSYLENRISWAWAQEANKHEAIVLNPQGNVAGGSRSNLFLLKGKDLITPAISAGAFDGITRKVALRIGSELNLNVKEEDIKSGDICKASEAFITSALMEIMPLVEFEDEPIGSGKPGDISLKILSEYRKLLNC